MRTFYSLEQCLFQSFNRAFSFSCISGQGAQKDLLGLTPEAGPGLKSKWDADVHK